MFKKGDIVEIRKVVFGHRDFYNNRVMSIRKPKASEVKGMIIGYSFIRTGNVPLENEPGYFNDIKDNKVWLVEPIINTERYLKPIRCLADDIKLLPISENQRMESQS